MTITYLLTIYHLSNQFNIQHTQYGGSSTLKWHTLSHNGVLFPPEYIPHKTPILYDSIPITLPPLAEEYATIYAKYTNTEYTANPKFRKNFWNDWRKLLPQDTIIKDIDKVDFTNIYNYIIQNKAIKQPVDDTIYKYAIIDGKQQPVGNYRIEPPGIFLGRGCHPKMGCIKRRIYPEDITINIGKESPIPQPQEGHKWGHIIHDKQVEWLASWKDTISNKTKYVWLSATSDLKAKGDMDKFDKARKLKRKIKKIRAINEDNLLSDNLKLKQTATALYFIDKFALRVGNEKSEDEADTVGVTSLRKEHVILLDDNKIKLDFLSKDSVRYNRVVTVHPIIYTNIQEFITTKDKHDSVFHLVTPMDVNKYLQNFMKSLTAKVFRTYNASNLFQKELQKIEKKYNTKEESIQLNILLDEFNKANAKVALLCNHQKNITKSANKQIDNITMQLKKAKALFKKATSTERKNKLRERINMLKSKRDLKLDTKNIALGTSKINYIDPRITISFLKKFKIPIDKIFTKTLQEKFKWAFDVDESYVF